MLFVFLVGIFCLSTTNTFAQPKKKETSQEKIIRLEVENKVLNEHVTSLTQEIASLQTQLATEKAKQKQATVPSAQKKQEVDPRLKPYYANMQVQETCEKFEKCRNWAREMYDLSIKKKNFFRVTSATVTGKESFTTGWTHPGGTRTYISFGYEDIRYFRIYDAKKLRFVSYVDGETTEDLE